MKPYSEGPFMVRLADYQMRLLLCRPDRKEALNAYSSVRLHWKCGCSALEDDAERYLVDTCDYHRALLEQVSYRE